MKLDDKTLELIAVGASVTAGCQYCLAYHTDKAGKLGAGEDEIAEAVAVGKMVRGGSATQMDKFVEGMADSKRTDPPEGDIAAGNCGIDSEGGK